MLYQLKRAGIGQHDLVTIYVSVIKPVLEYACPVWHTNLNRHITESIETVQKRALKCIYPGNGYADILCLRNLHCLKERRDSLCKKYFQKIMETTHRLRGFAKLKKFKKSKNNLDRAQPTHPPPIQIFFFWKPISSMARTLKSQLLITYRQNTSHYAHTT